MAIKFKQIRYKNFLSTGSQFTEIFLNKSPTTIIVGENGSGKCVDKTTEIEIQFEDKEAKDLFLKFLA